MFKNFKQTAGDFGIIIFWLSCGIGAMYFCEDTARLRQEVLLLRRENVEMARELTICEDIVARRLEEAYKANPPIPLPYKKPQAIQRPANAKNAPKKSMLIASNQVNWKYVTAELKKIETNRHQ